MGLDGCGLRLALLAHMVIERCQKRDIVVHFLTVERPRNGPMRPYSLPMDCFPPACPWTHNHALLYVFFLIFALIT